VVVLLFSMLWFSDEEEKGSMPCCKQPGQVIVAQGTRASFEVFGF
jgi:hypothetical protein